jgi:hypothetical protein
MSHCSVSLCFCYDRNNGFQFRACSWCCDGCRAEHQWKKVFDNQIVTLNKNRFHNTCCNICVSPSASKKIVYFCRALNPYRFISTAFRYRGDGLFSRRVYRKSITQGAFQQDFVKIRTVGKPYGNELAFCNSVGHKIPPLTFLRGHHIARKIKLAGFQLRQYHI